ncbi:MAG: ABC transporter permease [Acidobacteria bacterium]|nr:MAG: ABC transporter permease [Acidobacteriota bacterium]
MTAWLDDLRSDLAFAARQMRRAPGFAVVVVLTLGLGIGANAAIVGVINGLMLRPLPAVDDPGRLVEIQSYHAAGPHRSGGVAYRNFVDLRRQSRSLAAMTAYVPGAVGLAVDGHAERIAVSYVSGDFFHTLGVIASHGRVLAPGEGTTPGADPVVVLAPGYFERRFGGDPAIVGRSVRVNGRPFTVAGVAEEGFAGVYALLEIDAFLPLGMIDLGYRQYAGLFEERRPGGALSVVGRLAPGASAVDARAELEVLARRLEASYPELNHGLRLRLDPQGLQRPWPMSRQAAETMAAIFLALAALVLLVASLNVAGILLLRATRRRRELAIRAALGAGGGRLARQLLAEGALLAFRGGLCGVALGWTSSRLLAGLELGEMVPLRFDFGPDVRVLGFTLLAATASALLVGLPPAARAARPRIASALRGAADGGGRQRLRGALVAAQIAAALVVLIVAGLLTRSLVLARHMDLGLDPRGVVDLTLDVGHRGLDRAAGERFYQQLSERLEALPGVTSAAAAHSVPMGYYWLLSDVVAEGRQPATEGGGESAFYNAVGPGYFKTLRIPILHGRAIEGRDDDGAPLVAVVNETLARRLWGRADAVGERFSASGPEGPFLDVIGVAKDGKYRQLLEPPRPYFYRPLAQDYHALRVVHLRGDAPPAELMARVRAVVAALDPELPIAELQTLEQALDGAFGYFLLRWGAAVAAVLGLLGTVLALVGVYGVVAYATAGRRRELAVRMALGARPAAVAALVLRQGLALVAWGLAGGLAVTAAVARLLRGFLYGVAPGDPATWLAAALLLASVALAACYLPARRAMRLQPGEALRVG